MILFLNFAPIEFMGGAEKWMYETSQFINKKENLLKYKELHKRVQSLRAVTNLN